jgi:predicted permease
MTALRRLRGTIRTSAFEREMAEELQHHIAFETEALLARGFDAASASLEAKRRFGSVALTQDACRDSWGLQLVDRLAQDVRFAARLLTKHPSYSATIVLTLALGIGANTAIFSVVHAVLLRELPYASGDRLIEIRQQLRTNGVDNIGFSARDIDDYRAQTASLDGIVEYHQMSFTLLDHAQPSRVVTGIVSPAFFDLVGVAPILGRRFRESDNRRDAPAVLILSHGYWQRALGGDPHVVGRTFEMNDRVHTVVGVLPPVPQYPGDNDVYMPVSACPFRSAPGMATDRRMRMVSAIGRLKKGVTVEAAKAELALIADRLAASYPDAYDQAAGFSTTVVAVREQLTNRARPLLWLLLATTAFVLLLVCANVANLMLARVVGRERELSLRTALGAGRARLARQLLTESLLLALAGGVVGLILAALTRDLLVAFTARFSVRATEISIDHTVLLFGFSVSVATGLLFGVLPVRSVAAPTRATPIARHRTRQLLIAAQVAISFVLLISAGLVLRSFIKLRAVDGGFDSNRVLTALVDLDWVKYDTGESRRGYFRALLDRLGREPGVEGAALGLTFPLNDSERFNLSVVLDRGKAPAVGRAADFRLASPDYFRTIGMSLLNGRVFTAQDTADSRPVAIVNLAMARHYFGDVDPVGRRLSLDNGRTWRRVVGLVSNVRQYGLATEPSDEIYVPFDQRSPLTATLLLRTTGDPSAMWQHVLRVARALDARQPISRPLTLEQVRSRSMASPRLTTMLLMLFAVVALLTTAAGIAGVVSFLVTQRAVEIGVRRALGATRWALLQMIVGQALTPVAAGLAVGVGLATLATPALNRLLFEVRPTDPFTYAAVIATLIAVAAIASIIPAGRAATIEPATTLRAE